MRNSIKLLALAIVGLFACLSLPCMAEQCSDPCNVTSVKASHILVDTKKEAKYIKSKLDSGTSFKVLAKVHSKCSSGQNGGDLGYFGRKDMVQKFEDVAFNLPIGQVSDPVKTQFGWHLIKVLDKK